LASALSEDGQTLPIELTPGTCLVADPTPDPATVAGGSCAASGAVWEQDSVSGTDVVYRHVDSGQCLTAYAPPTPEVFTLASCDGRPEQTVRVRY
ncbi:MAG: hypothetical protein AAF547_24750, partial [Actinomycetota bacterium]